MQEFDLATSCQPRFRSCYCWSTGACNLASRLQSLVVPFGGDLTLPLMELDAQVEDTLQASAATANPEQKHKHKKKDKHKHKHHKKSKRERHGDVIREQPIDEAGLSLAEGEVARTGSEDGELPGPPAVEGPALSSVSVTDEYQEAADRNFAGLEQNKQSQQTVFPAKRR